jgi:hypothetical protein
MRNLLFVLAVLAFVYPSVPAQNDHPPVYLTNGYQTTSTSTIYWRGFYVYDKTTTTPTLTKLFDPPYYSQFGSACMDWDNKSFIFATSGTTGSGTLYDGASKVYHYDLATKTLTTMIKLWRQPSGTYPYGYQYCYDNILIDQNGDYVFSFYQYKRVNTPTTVTQYTRGLLKYDLASSTLTTLLTTASLPNPSSHYFGYVGKDIDTGKVMIATSKSVTSPTTIRYPVITINPEDGYNPANVGYWNDGSVYGWYNYSYNLEQNVKNGYIEGPYYSASSATARINQLMPGSGGMTTIASISTGLPFPSTQYLYTGKYDLQTSAKPKWMCSEYYYSQGAAILDIDVGSWTVNTFDMLITTANSPYTRFYAGQFEFLGGRHIQTVSTSANQWSILLSVPHHPGKAYAMMAGVTGVRPGIPLADGRNLNINFDAVGYVTLNNLLPGIWNPGPGILGKAGEARGALDLSGLPVPKSGLGIPLWIAVVVLDPKAPGGIAYAPDTYVMRL